MRKSGTLPVVTLAIAFVAVYFSPVDATGLAFRHSVRGDMPIDINMSPRLRPGGLFLTYDAAARERSSLVDAMSGSQTVARGRAVFHRNWQLHDDRANLRLGPDFDASRCASCHVETSMNASDWRNTPVFVAKPAFDADRRVHGDQVNSRHVDGSTPQADIVVTYNTSQYRYPDGDVVELQAPVATAISRDGERFAVELRLAPLLFGWGLLEQVDPEYLAIFDDPQDKNGDGISGRLVRNKEGQVAILGWKNSHVSLNEQVAAALANDMGIDSSVHCVECDEEISAKELRDLVNYVRFLGVPDRREGATLRGQDLFGITGCSDCHVSVSLTGEHEQSEFSSQVAWPFTDFALHDMGEALSAPGDSNDAAEWRTAPLWGVGVVEERFPERGFLHDGRARTIEEAVLWHGGEAAPVTARFQSLSRSDRRALLDYVRSL